MLDDELLAYLEEAGGRGLRDRYLASMVKPFDTSTALSDRKRSARAREMAGDAVVVGMADAQRQGPRDRPSARACCMNAWTRWVSI